MTRLEVFGSPPLYDPARTAPPNPTVYLEIDHLRQLAREWLQYMNLLKFLIKVFCRYFLAEAITNFKHLS